MIDVPKFLGSVNRAVETCERDGKPAKLVRLAKTYPTDQADLWDALTNKERLPRWFLPISGDLKLGGKYQFEGNAGGTILACQKPERISVSWEMNGGVSWVDVFLNSGSAGKTELVLEHVALEEGASKEFWDQYGPGAVGVGWDLSLIGMELHLESGGAAVNPEQVAGWTMSAEGLAFMGGSSDAWCKASIADGTEAAQARAAADRTTAFYTGAPEPGSGDAAE